MEVALDFIASLWELTKHQICVMAKTCVLRAMGEVTGALLLTHPFTEEETKALRGTDSSPWFSVLVTKFACKRVQFGPQEAIPPPE